ncbi:hypothetical protein ACFZDG_35715 [Kitasatospora xanthocidica]|uniref:hypothetical protein n=1 Tax=Kitasatospora xanthocidica TaxID=83382 RepID=UPI0036E60952
MTTVDRDGNMVVRFENILGREMASGVNALDEYVAGYVIDARIMFDCLGSAKSMPKEWHMLWSKILSLQKLGTKAALERGLVKTSQRDLQKRCGLSAAIVNEGMNYFMSLPWIRPVRRGLFQTNPALTVAGSSGEHEEWLADWRAAVGDEFILPGPAHAGEWRDLRRAAAKKAKEALGAPNVVPLVAPRRAPALRRSKRAAEA